MTSTSPIGRLFGPSPFKALQQHMRAVLECAAEVPPLMEALCQGDQERVEAIRAVIFEKEEAADRIKNELRANLPRSLFMPVDRRDLLEVLEKQDSIADTAQDIAGLLVERRVEVPAHMREPLMTLTQRCYETCVMAGRIIEELDELLETGFRGKEATLVEEMVGQLNLIEDETDRLGLQLTHQLFEHEDEMKPVSVFLWYQLLHWIGDLADYAEKVGNRLRLLIAR
jgi:predicted phosphate transport protein (TIGR00153 family)